MKRILDYNILFYLSIAFFFIVNIFIVFNQESGAPSFFISLKEYTKKNSEKIEILNYIYSNLSKNKISSHFNGPNQFTPDFINSNSASITVEPIDFKDSQDKYGFLNIYTGNVKTTFPFKKIISKKVCPDYSLYVQNQIEDENILNKGGMVEVSLKKKIFLNSRTSLFFNVYFEDIKNFIDNYLMNERTRDEEFFTGFDKYGVFFILKDYNNHNRYRSAFRLLDFSEDTINNIESPLSIKYLKWIKKDNNIFPSGIVNKNLSSNTNTSYKHIPDIDYYLPRATFFKSENKNIQSHVTSLNGKGIFVYNKLFVEASPANLKSLSELTLVSSNINIHRNIETDKNNLSIVNISSDNRSFVATSSKINANIYSYSTPVINNLTIEGNLILKDLNKNNIKSSLNIKPMSMTHNNEIIVISPVVNFFSGDL